MLKTKTIKVVSLISLSLVLVVGLSGCGQTTPKSSTPAISIAPPVIEVGAVVATNGGDHSTGFLFCAITAIDLELGSYTCKYPDGSTGDTTKEAMIYSVPKQDPGFKVGDAVLAAKASAFFETGKVKEVKAGNYVVTFDQNGDDETIPVGRFLPMNLVDKSYLPQNE